MKKRTESIQMMEAFDKAGKRVHLGGNSETGVIIALDVEGRLFTVLNGEVLNRVIFEAITGQNARNQYLNPGGDGLGPAPEGTTLGYQYATQEWRVAPGLRSARYLVAETPHPRSRQFTRRGGRRDPTRNQISYQSLMPPWSTTDDENGRIFGAVSLFDVFSLLSVKCRLNTVGVGCTKLYAEDFGLFTIADEGGQIPVFGPEIRNKTEPHLTAAFAARCGTRD